MAKRHLAGMVRSSPNVVKFDSEPEEPRTWTRPKSPGALFCMSNILWLGGPRAQTPRHPRGLPARSPAMHGAQLASALVS